MLANQLPIFLIALSKALFVHASDIGIDELKELAGKMILPSVFIRFEAVSNLIYFNISNLVNWKFETNPLFSILEFSFLPSDNTFILLLIFIAY